VEAAAQIEDVTKRMDFDHAQANFYAAARDGLGAHFTWLDGEEVIAQRLLLDRLLPMAEAGLRREGIADEDVKKDLGIVEHRTRTGRNGSRWRLASRAGMKDKGKPGERLNALVAATLNRQATGRRVADWERARLDEAGSPSHNYFTVDQYMTTDLFT